MIKSLYFEITNNCNLFCKHCYNASNQSEPKYIDAEILLNSIRDIKSPNNITIQISGGEPLLHPKLNYIIETLHSFGCKIMIVSNSLLITKEIATLLNENDVGLQISIDGIRHIHNKIRGEGVYDRALNSIKILRNYYNMENAIVKAVITNLLLGHVKEYVEEMLKLDFKHISFGYLSHSGRAIDSFYSIHSPSSEDLIKLDYEIEEVKKLYPDKVEIPIIAYSCGLLHNSTEEYNIKIDVDGNIFICQGFNDVKYSIGNINYDSIENCLISKKFEELISTLRERQSLINCNHCILHKNILCNKGCPAEEININGNIAGCDDKCKYRINRRLLDLINKTGS